MTVLIHTEHTRLPGPCVLAIGVFDGVHLGHQALISAARAEAAALDIAAVALTFDRDPDQVVSPESAAPQLLTLTEKCSLLEAAGADSVLVVPFTPELASLSADDFLADVLGCSCEPVSIHVGHDFRFGSGAAGDVGTLQRWGSRAGTAVRAHDLVLSDGEAITSTRIRSLVSAGSVEAAARLLGRPHRISGRVAHGRGVGTDVAVSTANVKSGPYAALPSDGVYAGRALLETGARWPAGISVGVPPTFPEATDVLEAHLIGYRGDLYGASLTLEFLSRIRDQRAFDTYQELRDAITEDLSEVVRLVGAE